MLQNPPLPPKEVLDKDAVASPSGVSIKKLVYCRDSLDYSRIGGKWWRMSLRLRKGHQMCRENLISGGGVGDSKACTWSLTQFPRSREAGYPASVIQIHLLDFALGFSWAITLCAIALLKKGIVIPRDSSRGDSSGLKTSSSSHASGAPRRRSCLSFLSWDLYINSASAAARGTGTTLSINNNFVCSSYQHYGVSGCLVAPSCSGSDSISLVEFYTSSPKRKRLL